MGKRTTVEADKPASGKEIRTPADQTVKNFTSTYDDVKNTIDEANEELKESAKNAKGKHLNLSAYKVVKGLYDGFHKAKNESIASEKMARFLANFDKLRNFFKLDELANLQGRMIAVGEIGESGPRETEDDGEPDLRPRHLRQPGASVTSNPVADLAAKAGAKTSGEGGDDDPVNRVGRGKPH